MPRAGAARGAVADLGERQQALSGRDRRRRPARPQRQPAEDQLARRIEKLAKQGILVYGVQCLNRKHATKFYEELAHKSGGFHIGLDQFAYITDLVMAICYKQSSDTQLRGFEQEVIKRGRMNRGLNKVFSTMLKRAPSTEFGSTDLRAVPRVASQILDVDKDSSIREFVESNGAKFKKGRGFYEFTKTETIQGYKEIVLMDKKTGDMLKARRRATCWVCRKTRRPASSRPAWTKYAVFVQSTSVNRKLIGGTRFLYEVEDWSA